MDHINLSVSIYTKEELEEVVKWAFQTAYSLLLTDKEQLLPANTNLEKEITEKVLAEFKGPSIVLYTCFRGSSPTIHNEISHKFLVSGEHVGPFYEEIV